ncbi:MAG: hypothetical protein M3R69_11475 [Acidobacteriota bacterium]|nr:hypothetical protein [Acidobacteriota bacterium]
MYPGYCKPSYAAQATRQVKRSLTICFCMFVLLAGSSWQQVSADTRDWTAGVNPGEWDDTIALTTLNGYLYTIEKSGALYRTDLTNGKWVQLGKTDFANTEFLFAGNQNLFTIETDGSLYRVSPVNGAWSRVGQAGAWRGTSALVTLNNSLYSIESSGALYRTDLSSGRWIQIGMPEFANTEFMFADAQNLYTIEANGSLYRVNPANGAWRGVGGPGEWKDTIGGTTLSGRIYTVERSGALYETNPATGAWKQIGKVEFGKTQFMFGADGSLYSLENGDLYRINPSNGSWVVVGQ